jgi:hypothetical protein
MKLLSTLCLLAGLFVATCAAAADPIALGVVKLAQPIGNTTVTFPVESTLEVASSTDALDIRVGLDADLSDLQRQFATIAGSFALPSENCPGYGQHVVAKLLSASLNAAGSTAVVSAKANVAAWDCQKGVPGAGTTMQWRNHCWKVFGRKVCTKVPHTVTIQPGPDIKNRLIEDDVDATIPLLITTKDGESIEITPGDVDVKLHNDITKFLNQIAAMFKVSASDIANKQISSLVSAGALRKAIPDEFTAYNPKISSISFYQRQNGSLGLRLSFAVALKGAQLGEFMAKAVSQ